MPDILINECCGNKLSKSVDDYNVLAVNTNPYVSVNENRNSFASAMSNHSYTAGNYCYDNEQSEHLFQQAANKTITFSYENNHEAIKKLPNFSPDTSPSSALAKQQIGFTEAIKANSAEINQAQIIENIYIGTKVLDPVMSQMDPTSVSKEDVFINQFTY